MSDMFKGYKGAALETLKKFSVRVWSDAVVHSTRGEFQGIILPRAENDDDRHIVLKLITGYNVGIAVENITGMKEVGYKEAHYKIPEKEFPFSENMPNVKLFGTGGTIASRLDYRTGAVIPAFSPGELYGAVPELADICNLTTEKLFAVFSENMGPMQYMALAKAIGKEIEKGIDGIIIGHGTDTMHHTAAALSFMIQNSPIPIVLVGSQRSSDRPSSDAALNLMHAAKTAAESDIAEVLVCMFGPTSDKYGLLHQGTRVRKMHSSYRSTFRTIGDIPIAMVDREKITPIKQDYNRRRQDKNVTITPVFEEKVSLLYYYPNMQPDLAGHDYILERQLKPEARTDVLKLLKDAGVKPTSMIDISDGLASEILHLSHQSKLGATIYEDKLPIDVTTDMVAKEFSIDPTTAALNGGEDYELLFTVSQKDYDKVKDIKEVVVIGHMTEQSTGVNLISRSGTQVEITAQGWDAFLKKEKLQ